MRFLTAPVCVLFAWALAGAKAQLKNMLNTIGFYDIICVCAFCARRGANILQTERTSNKKLSKCKRKTPCHGSSKKAKQKKPPFWEPKCLQKSTPEASGSALAASCARLPRQELSKSALREPPGPKKSLGTSKGAPGGHFQRDLQKTDPGAASGGHRSAALARPVKANPDGFGPGKTRLKNFKHAHHRKRLSAD